MAESLNQEEKNREPSEWEPLTEEKWDKSEQEKNVAKRRFLQFLRSGEGDLTEEECSEMEKMFGDDEDVMAFRESFFVEGSEGVRELREALKAWLRDERELTVREDQLGGWDAFHRGNPEYEEFQKELESERPDVFGPDRAETVKRMARELIALRDSKEELWQAMEAEKIDFENFDMEQAKRFVHSVVDYYMTKIPLKRRPEVKVVYDEEVRGGEDYHCNGVAKDDEFSIEIRVNEYSSMAELAGTIGHELWHCYQFQKTEEDSDKEMAQRYRINIRNYRRPERNGMKAYKQQLVEQEARTLGMFVSDLMRKEHIKNDPGLQESVNEMYEKVKKNEDSPGRMKNGLDVGYLGYASKHE